MYRRNKCINENETKGKECITGMNNAEKNTYVKNQILKALLDLLKTKELDSISVLELTEAAQVGRVSFYRNYADKKDVLIQEERRLFNLWKKEQPPAGSENPDFFRNLLNYYYAHSEFYLQLYHAGLQDIIKDTILAGMEIFEADPDPVAYLKSSIGYMIYGWVIELMNRCMTQTGDELSDLIENSQKTKQ